MIDRMAPPKTILCTPSYALSITDLASCVYRPERCVAVRGQLIGGMERGSSAVPGECVGWDAGSGRRLPARLGSKRARGADPDFPVLMKNMARVV